MLLLKILTIVSLFATRSFSSEALKKAEDKSVNPHQVKVEIRTFDDSYNNIRVPGFIKKAYTPDPPPKPKPTPEVKDEDSHEESSEEPSKESDEEEEEEEEEE